MPGLSLQAALIWFSCPILQLLCVYLLYRRKLLRQFVFFASYLLLLTLLNGVRFFCYRKFGLSSWTYYSVHWVGTAVANIAVIAVLYEIFCAAFKVYSLFSGRRFVSDLRSAQQRGYILRTPHFNSIFNYLELPEMTAQTRSTAVGSARGSPVPIYTGAWSSTGRCRRNRLPRSMQRQTSSSFPA